MIAEQVFGLFGNIGDDIARRSYVPDEVEAFASEHDRGRDFARLGGSPEFGVFGRDLARERRFVAMLAPAEFIDDGPAVRYQVPIEAADLVEDAGAQSVITAGTRQPLFVILVAQGFGRRPEPGSNHRA